VHAATPVRLRGDQRHGAVFFARPHAPADIPARQGHGSRLAGDRTDARGVGKALAAAASAATSKKSSHASLFLSMYVFKFVEQIRLERKGSDSSAHGLDNLLGRNLQEERTSYQTRA